MKKIFLSTLFLSILFTLSSFSLSLNQINWLDIDYSDLVDKSTIIRTGQTLGSALGSKNLKGALQPFLDKHSSLLEYAVELINNESLSYDNIVDKYPIGSEQPAWVSLFRSGRMSAYTNYKKKVRIFLQGQNPETAYKDNYSIVRHMLNSLKPAWGKLKIEVYTFENNYSTLSLKLNPSPAIFSGSSFGSPSGKIPLDLIGLSNFFSQGRQLEGAKLDKREGLRLYAKTGYSETLSGKNTQLADLAVAYRAVFHAGDNKAFVSLDTHKDATKTAVNFGGYLEDTSIGQVVLEADKRFKTITSGLDPNTYKDLRHFTRNHVPDFLTVSERGFLSISKKSGWVKTRFWFYPDSIEVETDTTSHYAKIINPYFLADAERSRDDFNSTEEFEKKKKTLLLPAIRENIENLNKNYDKYSEAFPELKELLTVGRLMAICSWLYKVNPSWLDLDALLSVKTPAVNTERERTQLIASATIISSNITISFLSPDLDKTIKTYFTDSNDLATFLSMKHENTDSVKKYLTESNQLLKNNSNNYVRSLINSSKDLQVFAHYSANKRQPANILQTEYEMITEENKELDDQQRELLSANRQLAEFRRNLTNNSLTTDSLSIQKYNLMADQLKKEIKGYQLKAEKFNQKVFTFNKKQLDFSPLLIEIGGGINLEAESFKISVVKNSPQLNSFINMADKTNSSMPIRKSHEKWINSKVTPKKSVAVSIDPLNKKKPTTANKIQAFSYKSKKPLLSVNKINSRVFVIKNDLHHTQIKGEFVGSNKIVFKKIN